MITAIVFTLATASPAPVASPSPSPLDALRFLLGEWVAGANTGPQGAGSGRFRFALDLQDHVIVRTNHAEYPAAAGAPAQVHDDLMVIHPGEAGGVRADYFDSEGHVIHYTVTVTVAGHVVTMLGDVTPGRPRFRLTYRLGTDGELLGEFDVAPPGQPDAFQRYIAWEATRATK